MEPNQTNALVDGALRLLEKSRRPANKKCSSKVLVVFEIPKNCHAVPDGSTDIFIIAQAKSTAKSFRIVSSLNLVQQLVKKKKKKPVHRSLQDWLLLATRAAKKASRARRTTTKNNNSEERWGT